MSSVQNVRECLRAAHCALCVMVCVGLLCVHVLVCPRLSSPMCMVSLIWLVALRCVCVVSEMNGVGQLGMTNCDNLDARHLAILGLAMCKRRSTAITGYVPAQPVEALSGYLFVLCHWA